MIGFYWPIEFGSILSPVVLVGPQRWLFAVFGSVVLPIVGWVCFGLLIKRRGNAPTG